jgi:hypothetical protein
LSKYRGVGGAGFKVYDVNGRLVLEQDVNANEKAIVELNLNTSEGIYLLVLTDKMSDTIYKQKLVLQK